MIVLLFLFCLCGGCLEHPMWIRLVSGYHFVCFDSGAKVLAHSHLLNEIATGTL